MMRVGRMDVARALRYDPRFEARVAADPSLINPVNFPQTMYEHQHYDASPLELMYRKALEAERKKRMHTNDEQWNEFFSYLEDSKEYQDTKAKSRPKCGGRHIVRVTRARILVKAGGRCK